MPETILVLNAGSSSIKFQLFGATEGGRLRSWLKGQLERIGQRPRLVAENAVGEVLIERTLPALEIATAQAAFEPVIGFLQGQLKGRLPTAIGHRVVHGGPNFGTPVQITEAVLGELERLAPLAPLHQPSNLAPIWAIWRKHPEIMQVACFDTAFHSGHPDIADRYAVPEGLYVEGVRRYGFHGLSYEYVLMRLRAIAPEAAKGRAILAHLGSGASMCAVVNGLSVESTMGFTALDGLPMGTRPGQLDPGIVLYLMSNKHMCAAEIEHLLYRECGLKGLSGISSDVRDLLASTSPQAKLAIEYFVYKVALNAAMLAGAMGGLDSLVFCGGIGEKAPTIRKMIAERLSWLGVEIEPAANNDCAVEISGSGAPVCCYVIPTDEESMIAHHTLSQLRKATSSP
jgi:acetate kinase